MVQHIVLWSFTDGLDKDREFDLISKGFASFSHQVPGMRSLSLHRGFQGYDVCLISIHEDRQALEAYQAFPAHLEMKKRIAAVRKERASCDFEL